MYIYMWISIVSLEFDICMYVYIYIYVGTTILILLIYWTHLENWRNNVDPQTLVFTKQYYNQYQYWILKMINWHFAAYLRHLKTRCGLQENSDKYTTNNFAQQTYYSNIKTLVLTTKSIDRNAINVNRYLSPGWLPRTHCWKPTYFDYPNVLCSNKYSENNVEVLLFTRKNVGVQCPWIRTQYHSKHSTVPLKIMVILFVNKKASISITRNNNAQLPSGNLT